MDKIETPKEFSLKMLQMSINDVPQREIIKAITARDAAIRAESAALLKTCGEALEAAKDWGETAQETLNPDRDIPCDDQAWVQIEQAIKPIDAALVALREAGVCNDV